MLANISIITSILGIITGFAVIAMGDWSRFRLKFAGVALSTVSFIFLTYIHTTENVPLFCSDSHICTEYFAYGVVRNIGFIIFHIACGRDAVGFKKGDRRHKWHCIDKRNAA